MHTGEPKRSGAATDPAGSSKRVLVVDDNYDAAEAMAELIQGLGHDARMALDGPSSIGIAAEWRPDVVFLDIGLPGMDGYEVARRLQEDRSHRPLLVALTGYGQESDLLQSKAAGFSRHVVKPPELQTIRSILLGST
jgi:CheY-like chemotaxis protein